MTLNEAMKIIELQDQSFLACDIDVYLDIWAEDVTMEGPEYEKVSGRDNFRRLIKSLWNTMRPV